MNESENLKAYLQGEGGTALPFMPVTMMFAADQIGIPYGQYASNAELLTEAQLKTAERFGISHVSVISDPGVEAADWGACLLYPEDAPPAILEDKALLLDKKTMSSLKVIDPSMGMRMSNRIRGVELLKDKTQGDLLVEGWVEGPCAEAADLRGINHLMVDLFDDESFVDDLMDLVTEQAILFAQQQIEAGADLIGIGDAASSLIGPEFYKRFVLPRMKKYIHSIRQSGALVRLHICGPIESLYPYIAELDVDMIDLDSMNSISEARKALGERPALIGNLNPVTEVKDSDPGKIISRLAECYKEASAVYIIGAGCEIPRGTPLRNMKAMQQFRSFDGLPGLP